MIYVVLFLFLLGITLVKGKRSFIDFYLLYCLFFDVFIRYTGPQRTNFSYLLYFLVLVYVAQYLLINWPTFVGTARKLLVVSAIFLGYMTIAPVLRGGSLDQSLRNFAVNSASILVLPIAYHYYSQRGRIHDLLKIVGITTILWVVAVLFFTLQRIDTISGKMGSDSFGMNILYFGEMSNRGALSYIGLMLLAYPVVVKQFYGIAKQIYNVSCIFIIVVMLIALKRFTLIAVGAGLINVMLKTGVRLRSKILLLMGISALAMTILAFTPLPRVIVDSYYKRGGERKISVDAIENDVRLVEPIYIIQGSISQGVFGFIFGSQNTREFDIESEEHYLIGRNIHNQYGQYLLIYGLLGVYLYLSLFWISYRDVTNKKKRLAEVKIDPLKWLTFQNIVIVFVVGGMVGGHIHMTYRSLAFILIGGLGGNFTKATTQYSNPPKTCRSLTVNGSPLID